MRGDRVEIVVDTGDGSVRQFEVVATKAGRRVEVTVARGTVEVSEVTRSGQPVRSARFMASRVVALVEHPAGDSGDDESGGSGSPGGRRRGGTKAGADQPSLELG
jgi:hypothetical protein